MFSKVSMKDPMLNAILLCSGFYRATLC